MGVIVVPAWAAGLSLHEREAVKDLLAAREAVLRRSVRVSWLEWTAMRSTTVLMGR